MKIVPSFRCGAVEITETDLPNTMTPAEHVAYLNPTPKVTLAQLRDWEVANPLKTGKDNYGWRSLRSGRGAASMLSDTQLSAEEIEKRVGQTGPERKAK